MFRYINIRVQIYDKKIDFNVIKVSDMYYVNISYGNKTNIHFLKIKIFSRIIHKIRMRIIFAFLNASNRYHNYLNK